MRSEELVLPAAQKVQIPIWLYRPGSHCSHWTFRASGCVPGRQAVHETPSPISLSPHTSQNVEKSLNAHLLPTSHGFSAHVATPAPPNPETAEDNGSAGASMVVFVTRTLRADV